MAREIMTFEDDATFQEFLGDEKMPEFVTTMKSGEGIKLYFYNYFFLLMKLATGYSLQLVPKEDISTEKDVLPSAA